MCWQSCRLCPVLIWICCGIIARGTDIPRVRLPVSLTLPQSSVVGDSVEDDDEDEGDEQHVSAEDGSTLPYPHTTTAGATMADNCCETECLDMDVR